jgi:hypothetical protein
MQLRVLSGGTGRVTGGGGQTAGTFAIQTVNGYFLTAVNGGGVVGPGAIHTDATKIDAWETFTLQNLGGGSISAFGRPPVLSSQHAAQWRGSLRHT